MTAALAIACGVLGLAIGSFLNVVIWRVPRGENIATPPSHCPSCKTRLGARDNVPVLSWLILRRRCRHCSTSISARYPLVEAGTAALFVALAVKIGPHASLPAFLYLAAISIALALIDLDVRRLPNAIVLPSYGAAIVLLALGALVDHHPYALLRALFGMAAYYGAFFLIVFAYPKGMGFGDVKLAGVLGLYLGYLGWNVLAVGAFGGILLGGIIGMAVLATRRGDRKTAIPYGPFMLTGAMVAVFVGASIAHGYAHVSGIS